MIGNASKGDDDAFEDDCCISFVFENAILFTADKSVSPGCDTNEEKIAATTAAIMVTKNGRLSNSTIIVFDDCWLI